MKLARRLAALLATTFSLAGCEGGLSHDHPHGDESGHAETPQGHDDHAEPSAESGHGHEHAADAIGITRYTDRLELFAEHPPAIAGQELTFLAHLTILDGFAALEDATVTLVLDGPTRVEARVDEKLRPGIFQPTLTAPGPGTYRASLVVRGPAVEDTIDGFDIVVHADAQAAQRAGRPAGEEPTGAEGISFLKEQQWQVPFATAFAAEGAVVPSIEVAGEVTTPPSGQAEVAASISGRLVAPAAGMPGPGQTVRQGDLLATIAPAPAAPEAGALANLAVVEAEVREQSARAAVSRAEQLVADRALSQRELDEAHRELRVAKEAVQAARRARKVFSGAAKGLGGGTYRITAPIDGVVVEVQATAGMSVAGGEPLLRIVDFEELWIRARIPEQEATGLRADQDASFLLPGSATWLPLDVTGDDANASLVTIGRTVDAHSRTVDMIYALHRPDERLRVGAMVRVSVPAGQPWQGVVIPRDAVIDDEGRFVVYVQVEGETFEERAVQMGPRSGAAVAIVHGVAAGERVVTRGANVVRLASRATSTPAHGHVH